MLTKLVHCPNCQSEHDWFASKPWSPFCCERCKLIDLGDWASEKHAIAGDNIAPKESTEFNEKD